MNFGDIPVENIEATQEEKKVLKRTIGSIALYGDNQMFFTCPGFECISNQRGQACARVETKKGTQIKCKHCTSEFSEDFLKRVEKMLAAVTHESAAIPVVNCNGEEIGFRALERDDKLNFKLNIPFKYCPICRNKRCFISYTAPKEGKTSVPFMRCACGIRTYEAISSCEPFLKSLTDPLIELLFNTAI